MSAYSDWKCGALSDADYSAECAREAAADKYYLDHLDDERPCADCPHYKRKPFSKPGECACELWECIYDLPE